MRTLLRPLALCLLLLALLGLPALAADPAAKPTVRLDTSLGVIVVELYPDKAPKTVANFLSYVKEGFYDGTIFHRVIDGFMIQGGGFDAAMVQKKAKAPIPNESGNGLNNEAYTLAMARTSDPHSASAQFFINVKDNSFLDKAKSQDGWGYCVFGKVVAGKNVVDLIKAAPTGRAGMFENVPKVPVAITKATVQE
jgi:peptidyl-prolyl cis-trans isomerase B (cyclophilin B)